MMRDPEAWLMEIRDAIMQGRQTILHTYMVENGKGECGLHIWDGESTSVTIFVSQVVSVDA